jgi:class 3 adenylate cyclase
VICPNCSTENEAGRKFCTECGARLSSGCPVCGTVNSPTAKFCGECGTSLVDPVSAGQSAPAVGSGGMAGSGTERRVVSVMFADLVGFTSFAEGRDAEDVRDFQERYFATIRTIVERYGGVVEKFIGDAVMAVWGAPVGHEDDAERAVRAALDVVGVVGTMKLDGTDATLSARAAVMTGEAAVAVRAGDQAIVTGDLVNAAARLQGAAPAGAVLLDGTTHRATESAVAAQRLGETELRGKAIPIETWRAEQVVALRGGRGRPDRLEPPFVGRESEFQLLKDHLHAAGSERRARLVSVTGLAGIGKSRLAWELEKYIDGIEDDVYWHQGRSPAYGEGITFWALADMIRERAGIAESEDPIAARQKLSAALDTYVPDDSERRSLTPALLALLGLEDASTQPDRDTMFAAWRRLLERIAERGVVVLVFEDLQWADMGLIDFIESILTWSRGHRILVVTLARPELLERRPTWGAGQRNFTALHLDPLPDEAIGRMLDGTVPGLPRPFLRRIVERAAGIPLFAVETIRKLIDEGRLVQVDGGYRLEGEVAQLTLPESLRGLIAARLDALSATDRTLLQNAAVLGQTFSLDSVAALVDRSPESIADQLPRLIEREILALDDDPRSPERGQYRFVQGLIREVAYDTLAKRERRSRHLAAARYFEAIGGDELTGVLASHYLDAYLATPAGPEAEALATQSRLALRAAADRAAALGSYDLALDYLEKALRVTTDPAERARAWEAAATTAHHAAHFDVSQRFGRLALDHYLSVGDRAGAARAAVELAQPMLAMAREVEAIAAMEPALALSAGFEQDPDVIALIAEIARAYMILSDPRALELVDRALASAEPLDLVSVVAGALVTKGGVFDYQGRSLEGVALLRGAIELAAANGLVDTELRGRSNLANQLYPDDPRGSVAVAREARELARRIGLREQFRWLSFMCIGGGQMLGDWEWVLELVDEFDANNLTDSDPDTPPAVRAAVAAYRGDLKTARELLAFAEAVAPPVSRPEFLAERHAGRAEIAALDGRLEEAYDDALAGAKLAPGFFRFAAAACRYALWIGDLDRARAAMELLAATFERGRYVNAIRKSLAAGVAALEGRMDEAAAGYREAAATFRALEMPLDLGRSQLEFASLVGPADPESRAAAAEAAEIFDRLGSPALRDRLAAGLARWDRDRMPKPGPSRAERSAQEALHEAPASTSQTAP